MAVRTHADELFDAACDVMLAAQRLREEAAARESDETLAATLGCLQGVLHELGRSCDALGVDEARPALDAAARACERARSSTAYRMGAGWPPAPMDRTVGVREAVDMPTRRQELSEYDRSLQEPPLRMAVTGLLLLGAILIAILLLL